MQDQDPFNLQRFVDAQAYSYGNALAEVGNGRKTSHWMWYVFPQVRGLGRSGMAWQYGISSREEATAYLSHPVLGPRLEEISTALLQHDGTDATAIFGHIDALKLRSSMTLFAEVSPSHSIYHEVLQRFFGGKPCMRTLQMLNDNK